MIIINKVCKLRIYRVEAAYVLGMGGWGAAVNAGSGAGYAAAAFLGMVLWALCLVMIAREA
jgi:hypothetical protein